MTKAFTLLETLITITIIGIISAVFVVSFNKETKEKELNGIINSIVAKLQEAKSLSQSGKGGQTYGVKFNNDSYITFIGTNYIESNSNNVVYSIDDDFQITNTIPGNADIVTFSKIFGETNINAIITVANKHDLSIKKSIQIGNLGDVSVIE